MILEFMVPFHISCGVSHCHKAATGYSWTLLEAKTPILDGKELLRPLFLCHEHQEWLRDLIKDATYPQVWKLIEKGGNENVSDNK